jgi:hypothetical protein
VWSQSQCTRTGVQKNILLLLEIETRYLGRRARSLVTVLTPTVLTLKP